MSLFSDYCESPELVRLNTFEYEDTRYYLLPDYLEWYYQDITKPARKIMSNRAERPVFYVDDDDEKPVKAGGVILYKFDNDNNLHLLLIESQVFSGNHLFTSKTRPYPRLQTIN
jgi:hypothetical protein